MCVCEFRALENEKKNSLFYARLLNNFDNLVVLYFQKGEGVVRKINIASQFDMFFIGKTPEK